MVDSHFNSLMNVTSFFFLFKDSTVHIFSAHIALVKGDHLRQGQ